MQLTYKLVTRVIQYFCFPDKPMGTSWTSRKGRILEKGAMHPLTNYANMCLSLSLVWRKWKVAISHGLPKEFRDQSIKTMIFKENSIPKNFTTENLKDTKAWLISHTTKSVTDLRVAFRALHDPSFLAIHTYILKFLLSQTTTVCISVKVCISVCISVKVLDYNRHGHQF